MVRHFVIASALVSALIPDAVTVAQQAVNPQLVAACVQSQQQAMAAVDTANRRIELARQTNQPAAMRAAMDDLQTVLSSIKTQLAPCAELQAAAAPPAHDMANMAGTTNMPPPPAAAASDPHAGHVAGATPQAPAVGSRMTGSRPPAAQAGSRTPAPAADPHAGHPVPTAKSPSAAPRAAAQSQAEPAAPKTSVAATGHEIANMPGHNMANVNAGAFSPEQTLKLATRPEDLVCATKLDPKTAPRAAYAGKTYYFCSVAERDRFAKAPAAYRPNQ
jgi:YHS domain-containing protein